MKRRRMALLLTACLLLPLLAGCDIEDWGDSQRYKEDFHHAYDFKPGGRLYVENLNGSVEVSGWDRASADIGGTKYASTERGRDALKIDIVVSGDSARVRTVRPSDHRGSMGARYVIKVPRGTSLERIESSNGSILVKDIDGSARLETSNGGVEVSGLKGPLEIKTSNGGVNLRDVNGVVKIHTSNGGIDLEGVAAAVEADTSNGGVDLRLDALPKDGVAVKTSNGPISLRLPADINARVKAHTSNASLDCQFGLTATGEKGKNDLEGTIRGGGPLLDLATSNANIEIVKKN